MHLMSYRKDLQCILKIYNSSDDNNDNAAADDDNDIGTWPN